MDDRSILVYYVQEMKALVISLPIIAMDVSEQLLRRTTEGRHDAHALYLFEGQGMGRIAVVNIFVYMITANGTQGFVRPGVFYLRARRNITIP